MRRRRLFSVVMAGSAIALLAGTAPGQEAAAPKVRWQVSAGGSGQFDADIDNGGDFSLTSVGGGIGAAIYPSPTVTVEAGLSYAFDAYDFSGSTGFGGLDPWDDVHAIRVHSRVTCVVGPQWSVFGGPMASFSGEDDVDLADAFTGGGLVGVSHRVSETLMIGGGIGVFSRLEEDAAVIPFVTLDWVPADGLTVRGGTLDLGAGGGPGIEVACDVRDDWELAVGAQYQWQRFRLDDDGVAPDGVGEHTGLPVYVRSTWTFGPGLSANVFAGVMLGGELRLEDDDGNRISREDFDPAPLVGARVRLRF